VRVRRHQAFAMAPVTDILMPQYPVDKTCVMLSQMVDVFRTLDMGNENADALGVSPASCPEAITVGATKCPTDSSGQR